ncbi:MAG: L-histidine N(alpha)-methyltransferase [bacterium]
MTSNPAQRSPFAQDVYEGLQKENKAIPSKYFYDEEGDRLFRMIMNMPEYYLTDAEYEIFSKQTAALSDAMHTLKTPFNLIEFGAGDGYKTKVILKHLLDNGAEFTYSPVDISQNILDHLSDTLQSEFPGLNVRPLNMDYFEALRYMHGFNDLLTITFFLGSNIGNFRLREASAFLEELSQNCNSGDLLLLGVDLKKDPGVIVRAYDDPAGITARFNLNLLERMNRELGANFNTGRFRHHTYYDEKSGEVRSFIISLADQKVNFDILDLEVNFSKEEKIHTEVSRKFSLEELESIAERAHFEVIRHFVDSRHYFTDTLWKVR